MENNSRAPIGFFGLLTIVLIVLKLCHVISWSWLWVLSPIWIPTIFIIIIAGWLVWLGNKGHKGR